MSRRDAQYTKVEVYITRTAENREKVARFLSPL